MSTLRVASLEVGNFLGIRQAAIEPGKVTVLEGKNGSGKSSLLAAVQQGLGGGTNLARLAYVPSDGSEPEDPELVIVLKGDGNEEYRVARDGDKVSVKARVGDTAAFEDIGEPQAFLRSLYDPEGCNPVAFLNAKDANRALMLLAALPLKLDEPALHRAMGLSAAELDELPPIPAGLHALEYLTLLREAVFRRRTGVNRDAKNASAAADQTRRNAPAVVPDDHADEILRVQQERDRLGAELAEGRARAEADEKQLVERAKASYKQLTTELQSELERGLQAIQADHKVEAAEIRAEAERRIATLAAAAESKADELRQDVEKRVDGAVTDWNGAQHKARAARTEADAELQAVADAAAEADKRLAVLREQAAGAVKARALVDQAKQFDAQADALEAESERLTKAINELDLYRLQLTKELPIPGLSIEGRTIKVNGVVYDQLNLAQRVDIAVKVACLRAKGSRLPVLFVDDAEHLDPDNFDLLVEALKREGMQAFIGRVARERGQALKTERLA